MEKLFVIHAMEGTYQGLHGIESYSVLKGSYKDAEEAGQMESAEVMESFDLVPQPDEDSDEEWTEEDYEDAFRENLYYLLYEVAEDVSYSEEEIDQMLSVDPDGFIETYCVMAEPPAQF